MTENISNGICPLQEAVGNCFYGSQCKCEHSDNVKAPQVKSKKPLKVSSAGFTTQIQMDIKDVKDTNVEKTAEKNKAAPTGNLNKDSVNFVPTGNTNLFEETKQPVQYESYYKQEELNENSFVQDYANCQCCKGYIFSCKGDMCKQMGNCYCVEMEMEMEMDMDNNDNYFHQNSANCSCCSGYIYSCQGQICNALGHCHCYASEIEEDM